MLGNANKGFWMVGAKKVEAKMKGQKGGTMFPNIKLRTQ